MHTSAAPYDDKLPHVGCGCKYMKCNAFLFMTNNQLTINTKDDKDLLWDLHWGPSLPFGTYALPVSPLGKLPKS